MSTRAALRILLQGDIYHMMCVGKERPDHHPLWRQALNKTITKYLWKSMFGIYTILYIFTYLEMDGRHWWKTTKAEWTIQFRSSIKNYWRSTQMQRSWWMWETQWSGTRVSGTPSWESATLWELGRSLGCQSSWASMTSQTPYRVCQILCQPLHLKVQDATWIHNFYYTLHEAF